jgi:prolyl-tRNA synthetase
MGIIVETHNDEKGIVWPESVAPFQCQLINLRVDGEDIYKKLQNAAMTVLYDDREDVGAGQKFADADLLGMPVRLVVSAKTGDKIEWKERTNDQTELLSIDEVINRLQDKNN